MLRLIAKTVQINKHGPLHLEAHSLTKETTFKQDNIIVYNRCQNRRQYKLNMITEKGDLKRESSIWYWS